VVLVPARRLHVLFVNLKLFSRRAIWLLCVLSCIDFAVALTLNSWHFNRYWLLLGVLTTLLYAEQLKNTCRWRWCCSLLSVNNRRPMRVNFEPDRIHTDNTHFFWVLVLLFVLNSLRWDGFCVVVCILISSPSFWHEPTGSQKLLRPQNQYLSNHY